MKGSLNKQFNLKSIRKERDWMLDTLIDLVKDFMEPLTSLGKAVVMAVAVIFALLALVISIVNFFKRRIGTAFLFLGIAVIIGIVASIGFAATRRLGKSVGSDLNEGINMLPVVGAIPAYMFYHKHKKAKIAEQ